MNLPPAHLEHGSSPRKDTRVVTYHERYTAGETTGGLSAFFTMLCIVDLFGVFPVVALPRSIISCGIYGVPLVISVFVLQLYTAVLLGRSWLLAHEISPDIRLKSRSPYAAVAELAFGTRTRSLVTFLIDATVFGAGVPNFIFASQSMQLFWWKTTDGAVSVSYCVWMIVIGLLLCPVMWLGSPKDMKAIAITSVCIVTTVAVSTWTCIYLDDSSLPPSGDLLEYVPNTRDFLVAYGIIAFQFDIHPMLLTLQVDMKDSRRISSAVLGAFTFTGLMFTVTALLAAARYGNNVESNILQGMPPSVTLYVVALLVTLQLCLSSAVGNSALFQHVEDLLQIPQRFGFTRCLLRSGIVAFAIFLGESVPRFDLVMGLVGSTLTGPLMFIFPPLFFLKLCYMKSKIKETATIAANRGRHSQHRNPHGDGDWSDCPLMLHGAGTEYRTFGGAVETEEESEPRLPGAGARHVEEYDMRWYDPWLAAGAMMAGASATAAATYCTWTDAVTSATFSPPCLINSTAAARSFIESGYRL